MDGAFTGSFENLPVTAFKIALGIHNRTTRDNHWAWRIIGFLAEVMKEKAQGKKIYVKSKHMESETVDLLPGEGDRAAKAKKTDEVKDEQVKMHGFHTMIRTILEDYLEAQGRNLIWDLAYRGKVYKNVEFVLFVPFVKGDTKEADENCAKFGTRNSTVGQLCRYCQCPTPDSDNPLANHRKKTQSLIQSMVEKQDSERLRQMS